MNSEQENNVLVGEHYQYAGFGLRFLAYCVDFILLFSLGFAVQGVLGNNPFAVFDAQSLSDLQEIQSSSNNLLGIVVGLVFALAYYLIFWVNYNGATPGKRLLGIKIIRDSGEKLSYPVAFIRYIGLLISSATIFFFALGFLWIIWDKKKQALHDKIAGTIVVRSGQSRIVLGAFIAFLAMLLLFGYMGAAVFQGIRLGIRESKNNRGTVRESMLQDKLKENQEKDKDKILSFAPSSCGLTVPVPKTTDSNQDGERKWLLEEVTLAQSSFYVLDSDVYFPEEVQGSFVGYKNVNSRLGREDSFSVEFPGLNVYCADNIKLFTLDEYASLALANKNYKVETQKKTYWGEVELIPITLQGKGEKGEEFRDIAYLGVTKDKSKLLYIRIWGVDTQDPSGAALEEDLDVIVRNLKYRNSDGTGVNMESKSSTRIEINNNVKGVSTALEWVRLP